MLLKPGSDPCIRPAPLFARRPFWDRLSRELSESPLGDLVDCSGMQGDTVAQDCISTHAITHCDSHTHIYTIRHTQSHTHTESHSTHISEH